MKKTEFYLVIVLSLVLGFVSANNHGKFKLRRNTNENVGKCLKLISKWNSMCRKLKVVGDKTQLDYL